MPAPRDGSVTVNSAAYRSPFQARRELHERLLRRVDARGLEGVSRAERRLRVREEALAILREEGLILPQSALTRVVNEVSDEVVGFGPIEFLLKDPEVTEETGQRDLLAAPM